MKSFLVRLSILVITSLLLSSIQSCQTSTQQTADSGISKASIKLDIDPTTGMTVEQWNASERLKRDNMPGSIKHLYVISSYSGECIMYSTVKGKVTSGGKRLSPRTVNSVGGLNTVNARGNYVDLNGHTYLSDEVLDDGGTYGESMNYLFWFDTKGQYQQIYPSGGMMIFISETPLNVKSVTINLGLTNLDKLDTNYIKKE